MISLTFLLSADPQHHGSTPKGAPTNFSRNKGRALVIAPQVDTATGATSEAPRYMARTKQHRTYLPYTFPAVAGTHLPTPRGWRVE